jgi:hypothetical protein
MIYGGEAERIVARQKMCNENTFPGHLSNERGNGKMSLKPKCN